jgi:hypothetical protein
MISEEVLCIRISNKFGRSYLKAHVRNVALWFESGSPPPLL